jgi:hypothetical protein
LISETQLAERLGDYKKGRWGLWPRLERILKLLRIPNLPGTLDCILEEPVLTRAKIKGSFNLIKAGRAYVGEFPIDGDQVLYEIVEQWRVRNLGGGGGFTVSIIVWNKYSPMSQLLDRLAFKKGMLIKIREWNCIWHPLHRWAFKVLGFISTGKWLDVGSSVEVYPVEVEWLER